MMPLKRCMEAKGWTEHEVDKLNKEQLQQVSPVVLSPRYQEMMQAMMNCGTETAQQHPEPNL